MVATEVLTLTAFSLTAEFLAVATADGRVKIWDVRTGHLRGDLVDVAATPSGSGVLSEDTNGHLALDYSCITWGSLPTNAKKGKKKGTKNALSLVLVLGTGAGDVLAWDVALGQLKWRTNGCNSGGVKSIAFSKGGQVLYTAGADGMISELNCETGELLGKFRAAKTPLSCIAISPDGDRLLAASSELKLFDLSSKKRICKFTGHAAVVNAMVFSEDGKYVLSSAAGERQVPVWHVEGMKSDKGALFSLALDNPAVALDCSSFKEDNGTIKVVALSQTGVAYVWQASSVGELATVRPMTINVASTKSAKNTKGVKARVLAARLEVGLEKNSETVVVAHGSTGKPVFEHVIIGSPGTSVVLDAGTSGALLPQAQKGDNAVSKSVETTVLGPENAADAILTKTRLESEEYAVSIKRKKRRASVDLDANVQNTQVPQDLKVRDGEDTSAMDEEVDDDDQTMEERLIALGIVEKLPGNEETETQVVPPRADSVLVLLSQALQAEDRALLEQCLAISDEKVIANTVRALRPSEAAKFLRVCIVKLETRPKRGLALVPWVRSVLLQHAATLMSNPAMQPVLAALYQLIEARLSVFRPLLAMSGRLDLIMAQISLSEAPAATDANAVVVYEEQDSELEVEEVGTDDSSESSSEKDTLEDDVEDDVMDGEGNEVRPQGYGNGNGHESPESDGDSDS